MLRYLGDRKHLATGQFTSRVWSLNLLSGGCFGYTCCEYTQSPSGVVNDCNADITSANQSAMAPRIRCCAGSAGNSASGACTNLGGIAAGRNEPSREGQALLSCVYKTHTITLVREFPGDVKGFPAALLALIPVGWRANSRGDGHPLGALPTPTVATTVLLPVSITETEPRPGIRKVGAGSVRCDGHLIGAGLISGPSTTVATTVLLEVSITETDRSTNSLHRRGFRSG